MTLLALSVNETGLSVSSIRLVPNMKFQTVQEDKQTVNDLNVPDRPVTFLGQSGTFHAWVLELRIFVTDKP